MMAKFDFKSTGYFSSTVIVVGVIFSVVGSLLLLSNFIGGLILLLVGTVIFTTHYRLMIDFDKKTYHDYVWILGLKSGDKGNFECIEYLFIKKNRVSQNMSMQVASTTVRKEIYDGYLRFSETEKIHLLTKDNKNEVLAKLEEISIMLNVRIIDYSDGEGKEIRR